MSDIGIELPGGAKIWLTWNSDLHCYEWRSDLTPEGIAALGEVGPMTDHYQYSPADGEPGHRLVRGCAELVDGKPILPPVAPIPEGAVC